MSIEEKILTKAKEVLTPEFIKNAEEYVNACKTRYVSFPYFHDHCFDKLIFDKMECRFVRVDYYLNTGNEIEERSVILPND